MKIKRLITLIETLAMTGLVSVGFSSWLIIETNPAILEGKVNVEEVFDNNDYLTIKNMTFSDYYYSSGGGFYDDYVYGTAAASNPGVLEFDIIIDLNKYRTELMTTPSSIELNINLSYTEQHNGEKIGNFMDIISRSLSKTASETSDQGSFTSTFVYLYDGVSPSSSTSIEIMTGTQVAYSSETPSPNIDRVINFSDISSINKISISAEYVFKLDGGFTSYDNASLNEGGIPFKLHATLENA